MRWAAERLARGPVLIASSTVPDQVAAVQARHGHEAAGRAIEQAMATIAAGLVRHCVHRLVAAGVPVLRSAGGQDGAMLMALKSGNFGGVGFFRDALDLMR